MFQKKIFNLRNRTFFFFLIAELFILFYFLSMIGFRIEKNRAVLFEKIGNQRKTTKRCLDRGKSPQLLVTSLEIWMFCASENTQKDGFIALTVETDEYYCAFSQSNGVVFTFKYRWTDKDLHHLDQSNQIKLSEWKAEKAQEIFFHF